MKWNKLRFVGTTNVDLPLQGADPSGPYVLKSVDGLGPPERDVFLARTIQEGGVRQGTRSRNRSVVPIIGLQPEWDTGQTAEELRSELYGLIAPPFGQPLIAQVMLGNTVIAQCRGDISRFEAAMFTSDPAVQMTLDCDYPYLLSPTVLSQFPAKTVVSGKTAIDIANPGDAPAGFWLSLTLQSAQSGPLVISEDSILGRSMTIGGTWGAGDTLTIDTRAGQRGVWRKASGSSNRVSVLGDLTGDSPWLQLHKGPNRLLVNNLAFDWAGSGFQHTIAYWGV